MVDPRMEDDQLDLQTKMVGSVVGKTAKSQTLDEEPTNAGGKDMLHVPMCTDLGLMPSAHDLSITERRVRKGDQFLSIEGDMGGKTKKKNLSVILNLSPHFSQEVLKKSKKGSKKLNKMDWKMLRFNEEDGDGVRSGESASDS
ncbi:hypothetical protein Ancab_033614 [Ancistrocladus abbreviatus]